MDAGGRAIVGDRWWGDRQGESGGCAPTCDFGQVEMGSSASKVKITTQDRSILEYDSSLLPLLRSSGRYAHEKWRCRVFRQSQAPTGQAQTIPEEGASGGETRRAACSCSLVDRSKSSWNESGRSRKKPSGRATRRELSRHSDSESTRNLFSSKRIVSSRYCRNLCVPVLSMAR